MSKEMNIQDILRGTTVGPMQSVGMMTVIPLLSEIDDDRFISPKDARFSTVGYGNMKFDNKSDKTMLVPAHLGYAVKQQAQDHAMAHVGLVGKKSQKVFDTAMCIQSYQGGYVREDTYDMKFLPFPLRQSAFDKRKEKEYGKLWNDIGKYTESLGIKHYGSALVDYYDGLKKELNEFVSQFELVNNQIGAIILINGQVVGLEKAPSRSYWADVWEPIIRDCYGGLVAKILKSKEKIRPDKFKTELKGEMDNLADIQEALKNADKEFDENSRKVVREELLSKPLSVTKEDEMNKMQVLTVSNEQFYGQLVSDDTRVSYASLISKDSWLRNETWHRSEKFDV